MRIRYPHLLLLLLVASAANSTPRRAVSLRVLQETVRAGSSRQALELCGITRVQGVIPDKNTHDLILFGQVDPSRPALHLDDLVVAFRSAWYVYARSAGRARYYSPPGCSIDPSPDTLRQLQDVSKRISEMGDVDSKREAMEEWKAVGHQPQKVRVMGVPFDSHFAKVMVDADFYMKRLVNGSVNLEIDGFESLLDKASASFQKAISDGTSVDPGNTLNRFWFCPGDTTFSDDGGVLVLKTCPVKLLTEEEFLTQTGVKGYGRPNAAAQQFTESFTARYAEIGDQRPIYKELEGLFRLAALAQILKAEGAISQSGFDMRYLLSVYPVKVVPVSRAVTGLTRVKEDIVESVDGESTTSRYFWHMTCGGVSMDFKPRKVSSHPETTFTAAPTRPAKTASTSAQTPMIPGSVAKPSKPLTARTAARPAKSSSVRTAVLGARKTPKSLYWDVPDAE